MILVDPSFLKPFFPWILWKGPSDKQEIALTFDDGPHPEYTPETVDILARTGAAAAFFLNGRNALTFPGVVEKLHTAGHVLGVHGFSHRRLDFTNKRVIRNEIASSVEAVEKITGRRPVYFRPPYGRFDWRFKKLLREQNLRMVLWSLLTCDFREVDKETILHTVRDRVHNGAVLVFHDGHQNAPVMLKTLPGVLDELRQMGYAVVPITRWKKEEG